MIELDHQRILVTFLMHLGDLTLTTPFIRALRNAAPSAHLTMLVDEKLADVVRGNPCLNEIITIDKKGKENNLLALWRLSKRLSRNGFDVLINLHPNERCSFIGAMTRVQKRCGTCHRLFRPRWDIFTPLDRTRHAAEMYLDVLTQLGVTRLEHQGLETFPSQEQLLAAERFWQERGISDKTPLVGFNIGSAVETKRWSAERFALVADALAQDGFHPVFFGANADTAMVGEALSYMKTQATVATGRFNIGTLIAALSRCRLLITNDSGPMHLAISRRVPIVALYGPSHVDLYGPYTKRAIVVRADPPCTGCASGMKHHCDDLRCMKNLTVEQTLEAARRLLNHENTGGNGI